MPLRARAGQVGQRRHELGEVLREPPDPLDQRGMEVRELGVEHGGRAQRQQPDERAHLERDRGAVGGPHDVVEEAVLLAPERAAVDRDRDPLEVRDELQRHVAVRGVVPRQLDGDLQHPLAVEGHPGRAVRLLERPAARQRRRAVEDPDVVEPEEAALEEVAAVDVLAVDPPGEVRQQPLEDAREELAVALAADRGLALVDEQRGPRRHGRVDVAEVPLVGRDLAVGVHVARVQEQLDLFLGEVDVHERERRAVEGQVPRREPRVLPRVGHRDDVGGGHVEPRRVAHRARGRAHVPGVHAVLAQPAVHVVLVVLLGPQQPGERLAHDQRRVRAQGRRDHGRVEAVGLLAAGAHHGVEGRAERGAVRRGRRREAQPDRRRGAGRELEDVVGGALRPRLLRADRVLRRRARRRRRSRPSGAGSRSGPRTGARCSSRSRRTAGAPTRRRAAATRPARDGRRVRRPRPRARRRPRGPASARRRPTTRCCGTTASGAGAASPCRARGCAR